MFNTLMSLQQPNQQHFQNQSPNFGEYSNQYFNPQSFNEQQPMQQQQQNPNVNLNQNDASFLSKMYGYMPNANIFPNVAQNTLATALPLIGRYGAMRGARNFFNEPNSVVQAGNVGAGLGSALGGFMLGNLPYRSASSFMPGYLGSRNILDPLFHQNIDPENRYDDLFGNHNLPIGMAYGIQSPQNMTIQDRLWNSALSGVGGYTLGNILGKNLFPLNPINQAVPQMAQMPQQIMQNLMPQQRRFTNPHAGLGAAV